MPDIKKENAPHKKQEENDTTRTNVSREKGVNPNERANENLTGPAHKNTTNKSDIGSEITDGGAS